MVSLRRNIIDSICVDSSSAKPFISTAKMKCWLAVIEGSLKWHQKMNAEQHSCLLSLGFYIERPFIIIQ